MDITRVIESGKSYPVITTDDAFACLEEETIKAGFTHKIALIADGRLPESIITRYTQVLHADLLLIRTSEAKKTFTTVQRILSFLLEHDYQRQDALIALGGGITSDISGLAAGLYKRGIRHAIIATTTLSMADAAIGGKCAVNFGGIKNPVGIFKNPSFVINDLSTLSFLPRRQFENGMYEAVKTGLILDPDLFRMFEEEDVFAPHVYARILALSAHAKAGVVSRDPLEHGERRLLNFGHTIGHAIEATNLGKILHGEAVAYGMLMMIDDESVRTRAKRVFKKLGFKAGRTFESNTLMPYIKEDKKAQGAIIKAVIVREIGKGEIVDMSYEEIAERIRR